jgi:uncharacterized protein (DUF362 family)
MNNKKPKSKSEITISRRKFINTLSAATTGLILAPYIKSDSIFAYGYDDTTPYISEVAITGADNYGSAYVRQKVEHLFEEIGGISDIVRPGHRVAVKINLVGGSGNAFSIRHQGRQIYETMWTHPEVLRATGELLIDNGVSPGDLYIVEALWDDASYNNFGYRDVQEHLGVQFIDLDKKEPYDDFVEIPVGENGFHYESFICNRILDEIDVYISIGKMKQHSGAGVTHTIKNQIGIVPLHRYTMPSDTGRRGELHTGGGIEGTHLPRSISDLFFARPVHLSIVDGIMNSEGGEGVWNNTFKPADYNVLLAGKDPVATDSVASYMMGNDPEADRFRLPNGNYADNYLKMLSNKGAGTNKMNEIKLVGDGADLVTSVKTDQPDMTPKTIVLSDNFPNPFNASTSINFFLPERQHVTINVYSVTGQEIDTLVEGFVPAGHHVLQWNAHNVASGVYFYVMTAGNFRESRRMVHQK